MMKDDYCTCDEDCGIDCDGSCGCESCSIIGDIEDRYMDDGYTSSYYEEQWDS